VTDHERVIAIDGPAAAGKSTVARLLADRLGAMLFDTGVLYRAVALIALRANISPHDEDALAEIARQTRISVTPASRPDGRLYDVLIEGEDVTWAIRSPEVGSIVSRVSEHSQVRAALLPLQRQIANAYPVVMVGRDIGTVVVPDAGLKIYLDASPPERALRRFLEARARGNEESFADVLAETLRRDAIDSGRRVAPLRAASDATRIVTDGLHIGEVVSMIEEIARSRRTAQGSPLWPA
jgi:cytidylate kinase